MLVLFAEGVKKLEQRSTGSRLPERVLRFFGFANSSKQVVNCGHVP